MTSKEIIKKWEALGYEMIRFERREIYLKKENTYFHITNFGRIEYSKYSNRISVPITFEEHQLATKTFKMLG